VSDDEPLSPGLDEMVARVRGAEPRLGPIRLVVIDGPAGSGKTTLARALAEALLRAGDVAAVLNLDDLYEGWTGLDGVWDRLAAQVLDPLGRGEPGRYRRYDWDSASWAEWHEVPVPDVLIVEGCGAAPRAVDPIAVLRLWVEAPREARLHRGLERDGQAMRDHWLEWMASEAAHFAAEDTRRRADIRLST
jgi:uridine kinase